MIVMILIIMMIVMMIVMIVMVMVMMHSHLCHSPDPIIDLLMDWSGSNLFW